MNAGVALLHLEIVHGLRLYLAARFALAPTILPCNVFGNNYIAGVRISSADLLVGLDHRATDAIHQPSRLHRE